MANLYSNSEKREDQDKAEKEYQEALSLFRQLAEKDDSFLPQVAETLNDLARLHMNSEKQEDRDEAEKEYQEALSLFRQLAEKDSDSFQSVIENILYNLNIMKS